VSDATDDLRIAGLRPLLPPAILLEEVPPTATAVDTILRGRRGAASIVDGTDPRLLCVVGPCSIHDPQAALEYADRLATLATRLADDLLVMMRVYFEKPRTTVGWKGLINDPDMDGSFAINKGLRIARRLLVELGDKGVPAATELLDTIAPQFVADLISWAAIGARTTESQVHRQLASGLSMPIGFKNGTNGSVQVAIDAVAAARFPHHFLGVTKQGISAIVETRGNRACHVVMRGGASGPNYERGIIDQTAALLSAASLPARVMVDCSHGNSGKDPARQVDVAAAVAAQVRAGSSAILGVMVESHLVGGRQVLTPGTPLRYGQSITDACLGWEETAPLLEDLAAAARARRARLS
jgi:3-deoxy-7-phosphoheptulonate synthase